MEVCIAYMRGKPVMLSLQEGVAAIDGDVLALKGLEESVLKDFSESVAAIPYSTDEEGYKALVNAKRTAFLASLLGYAVGDECVNKITHILDSVHYDVLEYLGEVPDA